MNCSRKIVIAITAVFAVTLGTAAVWYSLVKMEDPDTDERDSLSQAFVESSNRTGGFSVYLMPVAADVVTDREPGEEVWDGLLEGIATDPDSQRLFSRLYGNVPVRFLTDPIGHDDFAESPSNEFPVVVSVKATREEGRRFSLKPEIRKPMMPLEI